MNARLCCHECARPYSIRESGRIRRLVIERVGATAIADAELGACAKLLDGLAAQTRADLSAAFPLVGDLMNASDERLIAVRGIGPSMAAELRRRLARLVDDALFEDGFCEGVIA